MKEASSGSRWEVDLKQSPFYPYIPSLWLHGAKGSRCRVRGWYPPRIAWGEEDGEGSSKAQVGGETASWEEGDRGGEVIEKCTTMALVLVMAACAPQGGHDAYFLCLCGVGVVCVAECL